MAGPAQAVARGRTTSILLAVAAILLAEAAVPRAAVAQGISRTDPDFPPGRLSWNCSRSMDLADFTVTRGFLILNNFTLKEETGFLSGHPYAELSVSLVNRGAEPAFPTVQVAVYDRRMEMATLALSLQPMLGIIEGRSAEQLTASVNIRPGELGIIGRVCVRMDG